MSVLGESGVEITMLSGEELVKPVAPENLEEGTETDLETDPLLREAMACWIAGVSWFSTCPTTWRVG